jgi:hypothetical protein
MTDLRASVVTGTLDISMLPQELRTAIMSELQPGERIDWLDQKKRARTAYVLTDRRVMLAKADLRGKVTIRSFEPAQLNDLERRQNLDGSGDLIFMRDISEDNDGGYDTDDVGFIGICDVKDVEKKLRALLRKSRS